MALVRALKFIGLAMSSSELSPIEMDWSIGASAEKPLEWPSEERGECRCSAGRTDLERVEGRGRAL